jgi:hypothetical protein
MSPFLCATQNGYAFALDNPDEATDLLIDANSDALTDRALVRASMQAIIDGHYFRTASGTTGSFDPAKIEAIGSYLFQSQILLDADGKQLRTSPTSARLLLPMNTGVDDVPELSLCRLQQNDRVPESERENRIRSFPCLGVIH